MLKIDKWHIILFTLTVLSIVISGFLAGQVVTSNKVTTMTETSLKEAKNAFREALNEQSEITKRLVDSLSVANRDVTTTVQGNQRNKSKGK